MLAIGRSKLLYNSIVYLRNLGERFEAIITDTAYPEYEIKEHDFKTLAEESGAKFFLTPNLLSSEIVNLIEENNIEIAISANWKYKIKPDFLSLFKKGVLNFHMGNLPDYKGNATVNWAILNGEKFIYANVHRMVSEIDSGDIISKAKIDIDKTTYVGDILNEAGELAPKLFKEALERIRKNSLYYLERGSIGGLRCYPRMEADHQINWLDNAEKIHRLIKASSRPFSGAFSFLNGKKVIIWKASIKRPKFKFLSVPGQIVEINRETGFVYVACIDSFLEIQEIEISNNSLIPVAFIKSIRSRFKYE